METNQIFFRSILVGYQPSERFPAGRNANYFQNKWQPGSGKGRGSSRAKTEPYYGSDQTG